jgi:hypothetical protein
MTGTPSRTTTAYDGGTKRHSADAGAFLHEPSPTPRGCVGRKLQAKLRSEERESHMRRPYGGRGRLTVQSPKVIRISGRICGGYVERRSRALPREICLTAHRMWRRAREAARSTKVRQKSAESISCWRTAAKDEHEEKNRNGVFDG